MKIKLYAPPFFYLMLLVFSISSLAFAIFVDKILGYLPCNLCLYQRLPYVAISILCLANIFLHKKSFIILIILSILASVILSFWHAGIELQLFKASSTCGNQINIPDNLTFLETMHLLKTAPVANCEAVSFRIFNLSMSQINFIFSIILFFLSLNFYKKSYDIRK